MPTKSIPQMSGPNARSRYAAISLVVALAVLNACGSGELPPVEDTAPSEDPAILDASPSMSDGTPIEPHMTETIATTIEMESLGGVGGALRDGGTGGRANSLLSSLCTASGSCPISPAISPIKALIRVTGSCCVRPSFEPGTGFCE